MRFMICVFMLAAGCKSTSASKTENTNVKTELTPNPCKDRNERLTTIDQQIDLLTQERQFVQNDIDDFEKSADVRLSDIDGELARLRAERQTIADKKGCTD